MLGCIPQSRSPEPQIIDNETAASEDVAKEVRDLRVSRIVELRSRIGADLPVYRLGSIS